MDDAIHVEAVQDGPDYTGDVIVLIDGHGPKTSVTLGPESARELFGKLGKALELIEANSDPEGS